MGCNCKNQKIESTINLETKSKNKIINTVLNFIIFLFIFILVIPISIPFIGYILFKTIVLNNGEINMTSLLLKFGKKLMENEDKDDEDDDDDELYENDDYELTEYDEVNKEETK
jgi:hypothetical protein